MQIYPLLLLSFIYRLPESPRWFVFHDKQDEAKEALADIYGDKEAPSKHEELNKAHEEEGSHSVGYMDMLSPWGSHWHPTAITIMGQVNQALTGYGAVSVYGPQIFELLGLGVQKSEYLTQANYVSYFFLMTLAWLLIDRLGRRVLMVWGAFGISFCFLLMTVLGGLAQNAQNLKIPTLPVTIVGGIFLFIATGLFGICWLTQPWLIPTEIYPATARAQGAAVSVIIWGLANFAVTLLTPIGFNSISYWLFLVFAGTNLFAGWWTWVSTTFLFLHLVAVASISYVVRVLTILRPILQRLGADLSRKINVSSRMQPKRKRGSSLMSMMANSVACRPRKAARMENESRCYPEAPESTHSCQFVHASLCLINLKRHIRSNLITNFMRDDI